MIFKLTFLVLLDEKYDLIRPTISITAKVLIDSFILYLFA